MTKDEEIDLYRRFVQGLPRASYLHDLLAGTEVEVERQIRNDWALAGTLQGLINDRMEAERLLVDVREKIKTAQQEAQIAEGNVARFRSQLRDLAFSADLIGKHIQQRVPA